VALRRKKYPGAASFPIPGRFWQFSCHCLAEEIQGIAGIVDVVDTFADRNQAE
jgi:hypothetical protein